jgi:erythromycin esterase-like protein
MSYARQLLDTYPGTLTTDAGALAATLEALSDCAQACSADADADLAEQNLAEMVKCIRLCLDCTDVCTATIGVVSRQTYYDPTITRPLLEACVATCKSCGDECARHAPHYEHCRVCEQACRRCEQACRDLLGVLK